jgi:hypothetical protein
MEGPTMKSSVLGLVLGLLLAGAQVAEADLVIDNFAAGSTLLQFGAGTTTGTTTGGVILGGERAESLTVRAGGFFGIAGFGPGGVSVAQSVNDQIAGSFEYSNFSPIDFTANGFNKFRIRFQATSSSAPVTNALSVTVTSGASTSTAFFDLPGNSGLPAPTYVYFNQFSGVDFTNIDSVKLAFDFAGQPGHTFAISRFTLTAIPEPATGMLAVIGGCGIGLLRRRRA